MKSRVRIIVALMIMVMIAPWAVAQGKVDQERMSRDIEIAENALATMIKQQFDRKGMWVEVKANYTPGFGVTMRLPNDNASWIYETSKARAVIAPAGSSVVVVSGSNEEDDRVKRRTISRDSARTEYYARMIKASKEFIADYGDLLSQLQPDEKILITNRGEGNGRFYYHYDNNKSEKRLLVTVEGSKADLLQLRQGKINRDQMISKIKVVNTESVNEVETDLELLSSIMSRLYRSDLSKTFYVDETIYYERLRDFGVIYYMSAYSSVEQDRSPDKKGTIWRMPTLRLEGLTQEQRDEKVAELYPLFEKDLKENIVEYAQTVKSLKEDEMLVFNVQITKCTGCNIPATLELSVKNGNIKKVAAGQMSKNDVVNSINVKRGVMQ
ncbi:MAG TPA: hypothetical protein VFE50_03970 [Cyclobacteriaceae bacterium]|nr:hypothetical protein [Cyclobacteriaceae bacterium]